MTAEETLEYLNHRVTRLEKWLWYLATIVSANLGLQLTGLAQ